MDVYVLVSMFGESIYPFIDKGWLFRRRRSGINLALECSHLVCFLRAST